MSDSYNDLRTRFLQENAAPDNMAQTQVDWEHARNHNVLSQQQVSAEQKELLALRDALAMERRRVHALEESLAIQKKYHFDKMRHLWDELTRTRDALDNFLQ